jgi:hypothetical protein
MLNLVIWSSILALTPLALLALGLAWKLIARAGDWMDLGNSAAFFEIEPRRPLCSPNHDPLSRSRSMAGKTPRPRRS